MGNYKLIFRILDIIVTSKTSGKSATQMFFYWVNSINNGFKVAYQVQTTQTSNDALQMPYTFGGLGRANNYV
jgi:hypothetical protein